MVLRIAIAIVPLLAACGGSRAPAGEGPRPRTVDAAPGDPPAGAAELSAADCAAVADHLVELGMARQRATKPADQVPTAEQTDAIRASLTAELTPECLGWSRAQWQCAMDAVDETAVAGC